MRNWQGWTIAAAAILVFAASSPARAGSHGGEAEAAGAKGLRGRDIVRLGRVAALQGTLVPQRGEWFLKSGETEYELHMGNHEYREKIGIKLEAGKEATVTGFVYGKDVAVISMLLDGKIYRFREDDGKPLWAGMAGGTGSGQEGGRGRETGGRRDGSGREAGRGREGGRGGDR